MSVEGQPFTSSHFEQNRLQCGRDAQRVRAESVTICRATPLRSRRCNTARSAYNQVIYDKAHPNEVVPEEQDATLEGDEEEGTLVTSSKILDVNEMDDDDGPPTLHGSGV